MEKAASSGNLISDDLKRKKKNAHLIENDDLSQLT